MIYGSESQLSARCLRKSPNIPTVFIAIICVLSVLTVDWVTEYKYPGVETLDWRLER